MKIHTGSGWIADFQPVGENRLIHEICLYGKEAAVNNKHSPPTGKKQVQACVRKRKFQLQLNHKWPEKIHCSAGSAVCLYTPSTTLVISGQTLFRSLSQKQVFILQTSAKHLKMRQAQQHMHPQTSNTILWRVNPFFIFPAINAFPLGHAGQPF